MQEFGWDSRKSFTIIDFSRLALIPLKMMSRDFQ